MTTIAAAAPVGGGWAAPSGPRLSPATAGGAEARPVPEPCRVLVVEDEGLVALEIETFLTGGGHEVVGTAADRAGALALVRGARPDLALVDRCLSGGDSGLELAADLSALGVSVLFVTGNCPEEEDGGAVARAVGCLHKPFDEGQLLTAVAVARRLARGGPVPAGRLPSGLHLYRV